MFDTPDTPGYALFSVNLREITYTREKVARDIDSRGTSVFTYQRREQHDSTLAPPKKVGTYEFSTIFVFQMVS